MEMTTRTLFLLFALGVVAHAAGDVGPFLKTTWDAARLKEGFRGKASRMMVSYWLADGGLQEGIGLSDRTTSGGLAWGESAWLMNYVMCYEAFRDTYWLDKIVDHFDRMMGNLSDPEGNGFLSWRDRDYSVGIVRIVSKQNADGMTIEPEISRMWVNRGGDKVTGHNYSVSFPAADRAEIKDETSEEIIATKDYKGKVVLTEIPGSKFTISGEAMPGARLELESMPGEENEYQVHDGMITYPIAQFIEIVFNDPALHEKYKKKADEYLAFIDKHIREKWEATWIELPDGCGAYCFSGRPTQRFPEALLPHNQYLALARTFVVLKDIEGAPNRDTYLEKATKMARYFKNNVRLNGDAYVWNYWDPYPPIPEVKLHIEDTGHGSIDIGFACEACNRDVIFTDDDLKRFSNTYTDVMWNQSEDDPRIAGVVDGRRSKRDGLFIRQWVKLAQWNPKVWDIALRMYEKGAGTANAPSLLYMLAGMAGVEGAEIEEFHRMKSQIEKGLSQGMPINGDFELGEPGEPPIGWTFAVWSRSKGRGEWVEGGHNSKGALMLEGIEGAVNVVAYPLFRTRVDAPAKFRLTVFYRTEGNAKPGLSFCGHDEATEKPRQYIHCPPLEASAEWKKAEWEVQSEQGVREVHFVLRNHGVGKVFYDDFRMEKIAE